MAHNGLLFCRVNIFYTGECLMRNEQHPNTGEPVVPDHIGQVIPS